jgi:NAD(P)-dependent dehydrogenase (short-subunit alcohol dehydrogenase family)
MSTLILHVQTTTSRREAILVLPMTLDHFVNVGWAGTSIYAATKAAVISLGKTLALEFRPAGAHPTKWPGSQIPAVGGFEQHHRHGAAHRRRRSTELTLLENPLGPSFRLCEQRKGR